MSDEPSLAVVVSRLDTISQQLTSLVAQMAEDRREAARIYAPREVYDVKHAAHEKRLNDLEDDNEERDKTASETRRQILFIVLGAFVTALCALIVALYVGSGGGP